MRTLECVLVAAAAVVADQQAPAARADEVIQCEGTIELFAKDGVHESGVDDFSEFWDATFVIIHTPEEFAGVRPEGLTVEIGGKQVAGVTEGSEEAFSEVIDRQTRAIRDY